MNALEIIAILRRYKVVPRIDGEQLKLTGETANLPEDIIAQIREHKAGLYAFLKDSDSQLAYIPITPVPIAESYPVSNAQNRLWVLDQFEGGKSAYTITKSLYLKGVVEVENLEAAFKFCIQRHESLRTVFKVVDDELRQIVLDNLAFEINYEDISKVDGIKDYLKFEVEKSINWTFDLSNGPLIRVKLFRLSTDEYAMIFGLHHIISDGWSVGVLVQEVMHFYKMSCEHLEFRDAHLSVHYKDYTAWLDQKINGLKGETYKDFWKNQFNTLSEPINLPADFIRPGIKSYEGAAAKYLFAPDFYNAITDFCKGNHVTLFNFFRSVLTILLYKVSGQENVVIGTPVSGRNHFELENQIGLYINTLPLSAAVIPGDSFSIFLKKISDHSYKAFEFQDYPLDKIIEDQNLKRDISRNPLFDVMMVLQNTAMSDGTIDLTQQHGFELGILNSYLYGDEQPEDEKRAAKFDLSFYFDKDPDNEYFLEIEYATRLFTKHKVNQFFDAFSHIVYQVLANPEILLRDIEIIAEEAKQRILTEFNLPVEKIEERNILTLLESSFTNLEHKVALITKDRELTYGELNVKSNKVAVSLLESADLNTGHIGLLMGRSEWTLISILGILQAGMAYVPIDVNYPASRVQFIIADAQLNLILVDDAGLLLVPESYQGRILNVDNFEAIFPVGEIGLQAKDFREHTAYIIYTSGSTGKPKGVQICQRNVIAFLKWAVEEFAATDYELLYASTSYCFDLSVFEFFVPLIQGKTIRLLQSGIEISDYLGSDVKVMINTVPSIVRNLLEEGVEWETVTALNMAGERVPPKFKTELDFSRIEVRNLYGPSEDTTYSTVYRFKEDDYAFIPIGKPVGYTQLYIMNKDQNLLPENMEGEIYLSGQSVAQGYFNQPVLTAEKFMTNPFIPELTMYSTGDLGRWLADGNIEFLGRKDNQVKVRGFRIELAEIQYQLEEHPLLDQAVVVVKELNGEKCIIAYCVGTEMPSSVLLKDFLAHSLPAYMIPDYLIGLENIPLNSNGKIDKDRLPDPVNAIAEQIVVKLPANKTEAVLLEVWKEILGYQDIGVTNNFFDIGGHSLKATRLRSQIATRFQKDLTLNEIFTHPTIEQLSLLIAKKPKTVLIPIARTEVKTYYPISYTQERLWVLTSFEDASKAYNMPAAFRVTGNLDLSILEEAFRLVINKYEILRTVFSNRRNEPEQIVLSPDEVQFSVTEIQMQNSISPEEELHFLQQRWQIPFDLEKGPLLNCFVLKNDKQQLLSFNMHHIISDGWSVLVLYRNIIEAYRSLLINDNASLTPLTLQYKDYSVWQRMPEQRKKLDNQLLYWKNQFKAQLPGMELPYDFNRPAVKTYEGSALYFHLEPQLTEKIYRLSSKAEVSVFMTLMAVVTVLLKKYTNQNDIIIGTPVAGRNYQQLEDQIGFFVNTLAIRTLVNPAESFLSLLKQEKELILEAFDNQDLSYELLIDELGLQRDLSRSPLFDVLVVLQNMDELTDVDAQVITEDLRFDRILYPSGIAKYDLTFSFSESKDGLSLELEYNTNLFKKETASRFALHLISLFEQVTADPEILVKQLSVLDVEDIAIYNTKSDRTMVEYDKSATVISLFQRAALLFPDHIAVVSEEKILTYKELDKKSGQLAKILMEDYGVGAEKLVMLYCHRTEWMIVNILAVLKAGGAYIPIDPAYPLSRTEYIMSDSGSKLMLCDDLLPVELLLKSPELTVLDTTELLYTGGEAVNDILPENLAYIIYTSGTTGKPKGVLIEHRQVTRLIVNEDNLFDFNADDKWTLFHSYAFDFSVWEIFGALLNGGTLFIVPKETAQDSASFYEYLLQHEITVLNQTPTAFRSLVQINRHRLSTPPVKLRYVIFGGEALVPEILREWHDLLPACKNINMYGITETTVHSTFKHILAGDIKDNISNIGTAIPTLSCYVLDNDLQPMPIGIIGEIYVGGAGVARGYLNKPELTGERFIENVLKVGDRLYKSGDFARVLPGGDIEYIGRRDDQVKIAGHRIELSEIETAMYSIAGIQDVIVLPVKNIDNETELVAYYITNNDLQLKIREELIEILPAYMIPSYLIVLPSFPLNQNGKLDKKALPHPELVTSSKSEHIEARNKFDRQITMIWQEVLRLDKIGIKDNFFDLGGNSLKATRVLSRIHEVFGVKVDLKNLFTDATIEHLSDYVAAVQWMSDENESVIGDENEIIF